LPRRIKNQFATAEATNRLLQKECEETSTNIDIFNQKNKVFSKKIFYAKMAARWPPFLITVS